MKAQVSIEFVVVLSAWVFMLYLFISYEKELFDNLSEVAGDMENKLRAQQIAALINFYGVDGRHTALPPFEVVEINKSLVYYETGRAKLFIPAGIRGGGFIVVNRSKCGELMCEPI